jgi:alpha-beta hydrolase superfamily lysophospholipase
MYSLRDYITKGLLAFAPLALALLTVGCGGSGGTRGATSSTDLTAPIGAPPTLEQACRESFHGQTFWGETSDGVRLYMLEAGAGSTAVVLAHGGGSNLCETLDFARQLVHVGYRIIAFDFRGDGVSSFSEKHPLALGNDLAAAVAQARARGARQVFLVGSSMGGAAIVQNTSALHVTGRISLSGTRLWPGYGVNDYAALPQIQDPFLYVGSRDDSRAPLREALGIFRRVGATDKQKVFYPGGFHGWEILEDAPEAKHARALVLDWIAKHS